MRRWALLGLGIACRAGSPAPTVDTDAETDVTDEIDSDTAVPWTGGAGDGAFTRDTFPVTDDPLGATALDGTWTGTFAYTEVQPLGLRDPHCEGAITLIVDGNAARHVVADLSCDTWAPNTGLGKAYGPMTGIGFASLDPADLSRFVLAVSLGARNMETSELPRVRVVPTDGHLVGTFDDVSGIGGLKSGRKLTFDAVLVP